MTRLASPVKPIAGILYRDEGWFDRALRFLEEKFSPSDYRGDPIPFDVTRYYEEEMGTGLLRRMLSFEKLIDPAFLVEMKMVSRAVEGSLSLGGKRRVNIDVGYLDQHKVVLASLKERGNKIYLGRGVWADMTLFFRKRSVDPLPWSFPDFRSGLYDGNLLEIRKIYREQMRRQRW